MQFIKDWLKNLALLFVLFIVITIFFREQMSQILGVYSALFGPIALLLLLAFTMPRRRRSR
jgi:hypothetical protein